MTSDRAKIKIVYQDAQMLVVDKPARIVVNQAESVNELTIQDWIRDNIEGEISKDSKLRNGIVHRLDKDTSGVMVVAKTRLAYEELLRQFREREVAKTYVALLHGRLEPKEGFMSLPMGRNRRDRQAFTVSLGGKLTRTAYKVVDYYEGVKADGREDRAQMERVYQQGFTLVEAYPKTGRTHQIRVAFRHLRHPLVGDTKYVGEKRARLDGLWCQRQFLHAKRLELTHPESGKRVSFEAELAEDLKMAMNKLK